MRYYCYCAGEDYGLLELLHVGTTPCLACYMKATRGDERERPASQQDANKGKDPSIMFE
jgi:hypothetical protein